MNRIYYYGAMAMGLLFAACTAEKLPEDQSRADADRTFYVNMNIRGDVAGSGTRADVVTFEDGLEGESRVNNAYFVFYDKDGNVVGDIVSVDLVTSTSAENGTVEATYKSVVPVSVRKGENKPTQVICYINPISSSSLQNPLNVIQTRTHDRVYTDNGFAMSNSVHYHAENDDALPTIATEIPEGALFKSENDAKAATEAETTTIYVERYATKLTFKGTDNIEPYKTATRVYNEDGTYASVPVNLTFVPEKWALNAEARTTYVIKSFRKESELGQIMADNYTYAELDGIIGGAGRAWNWNNTASHRSYWGMSPAYFTAKYPEVASDVNETMNQTYLTYNDLKEKGYAADGTQYFKETTVGSKALMGGNPAAAVASVIYVGHYDVEIDGDKKALKGGFYTYLSGSVDLGDGKTENRPYIYFDDEEENPLTGAVAGGGSMLRRFLAQTTILYKKNADGTYSRYSVNNPGDRTTLLASLKVMAIDDDVKALVGTENGKPVKLQANTRSLQFKSVPVASIYIATKDGYKKIVNEVIDDKTEATLQEANALLMQQVGYAYYYDLGRGYFNIPVKHLGWYRDGNENRTDGTDNAMIDWNNVKVGDFGMVRNHSYSVQVNKIEGLASGISDDKTPIVPPAAAEDYFVAYSVNILQWAVVPVQNVEL